MKKKMTLHVINGTHWDREWRHTAEQSKLRLSDLMDNIIEVLENKPEYKFFCVDGGTIVLEDYFTVRPENKERVKKLIKDGKMNIVKWYTLPETNTVAGESLVRNLLVGKRMSDEVGGSMKSGYTATAYGQPSQFPQLYQGFGIDTAIFYRGTNKHKPETPLFTWEGMDGSKLNTLRTFDEVTRTNWFFYVHGPAVLGKGIKDLSYTYDREQIPVHTVDMKSYEKAFTLLKECKNFINKPVVLKKALDDLLAQAMPYKIGNHILALNMEDNDEPYYYLPELIAEMNKISSDVEIVQSTLDEYMDAIINDKTREKSAVHKGELRYTTMEYNNFNALLSATHSSRVKIKLYNEAVETDLIYGAEPLAALAFFATGAEYPKTMLDRSWESLLKNHAHDSICGAAVDRAHEDMMYNFSISQTVAEEVGNRSAIKLFGNINTEKEFKKDDNTITLFNTLPYARKAIIPLVLDTPKGVSKKQDIGVDGSAAGDEFYDIVDAKGNKLPVYEISCDDANVGVERDLDTKAIKFATKRRRVLVEAEVPALGAATYAMRFREPEFNIDPQPGENRKLIARDNGTLENEFIKVTINCNGTYSLLDKASGRLMENLGYLTDSGETGSAHISNVPRRNPIITSHGCKALVTMLESNELRGIFKIETEMDIPAAATIDATERLRETKKLPIVFTLTVEKGSPLLKVNLKLNNQSRDHKLVINFPSGLTNAKDVHSESAWAVEKRPINWADHKDNYEPFPACRPMQNFVDVSDGKWGLAVLNKGLREYEIADDTERTIKITLLRTQRAYMTANASMIREELDKYTGQHSIGDLEYNFALYPHQGDWEKGRVLQTAYEYKTDIKAVLGVPVKGELPHTASFITITPPEKIMLSGLKLSEDGSGIVLRVWNATNKEQELKVSSILKFAKAQRIKMDESVLEELKVSNNSFTHKIGPHKVESFLLKKK
ncbi:MAG: glycosyl hydrolase-related protein [Firmicutes bacterium]|nr:glycosyl hydrolase-related protein [Bacillota bacterium]